MADIFISYARQDKARAAALAGALEHEGWSVWWDRVIPPGKTFAQVIEAAIGEAKCVLVLWSQDSVKSDWVHNEAAEGAQRKILVPALIDAVTLPFEFRRIQAADLIDWKPEAPHDGFTILLDAICSVAGAPIRKDDSEDRQKDSDSETPLDVQTEGQGEDKLPPVTPKAKSNRPAVAMALLAMVLIAAVLWFFWPKDDDDERRQALAIKFDQITQQLEGQFQNIAKAENLDELKRIDQDEIGPRLDLFHESLKEAQSLGMDAINLGKRIGDIEQRLRQALEDRRKALSDALAKPEPVESSQRITNSLGMEFVFIPPGEFVMGSPENEKGRAKNEGPRHQVEIPEGFYLQTTEVTQGQWRAVMGNNPAYRSACGHTCPVESVSWDDVRKFIGALNEKESGRRYVLPTEAQWEYACRAGTRTRFYSGDTDEELRRTAWYALNSEDKIHPVGQKEPNTFGLYDMHGNVWEWVEDDWHGTYQGAPVDGRAWIDEPRRSHRVLRGGSWLHGAGRCWAASRGWFGPGDRASDVGFRLALLPGQ